MAHIKLTVFTDSNAQVEYAGAFLVTQKYGLLEITRSAPVSDVAYHDLLRVRKIAKDLAKEVVVEVKTLPEFTTLLNEVADRTF